MEDNIIFSTSPCVSSYTLKCPICNEEYDSIIHVPKLLPTCNHTLCSQCINHKLSQNNNRLTCPIDLNLYENLYTSDSFQTNTTLLTLLTKTERPFSSTTPIKKSYLRKSSSIRTSLKRQVSLNRCSIHSLPLDVICMEEKIKICSQCALSSSHSMHTLLTDDEFMNQIDNLIDMFDIVDSTMKSFTNKENVSAKDVLNKFNNKINEMIHIVENTINDIINVINQQKESVVNFLSMRSNEIQNKYSKIEFDIKEVLTRTNTWMDIVKTKLDKINEINDPSIECLKLIDKDNSKNQSTLLQTGKQLLDRFKFISQTEQNINELKDYINNGITITPITSFINYITDNDIINNEKEDTNISSSIKESLLFPIEIHKVAPHVTLCSNFFNISDNISIINKLQLKHFKFQQGNSLKTLLNTILPNYNNYLNNNNNNNNNLFHKGNQLSGTIRCNNNSHHHNNNSKSFHLNDDNILLSTNNNNNNNTNTAYQIKENLRKRYKTTRNPQSLPRVSNVSDSNSSNTNENEKQLKTPSKKSPTDKYNTLCTPTTPSLSANSNSHNENSPQIKKDKIIFIKSQLKKDSANFSRIEIGDDGIDFICKVLSETDNNNNKTSYKEIKLVKSHITEKSVRKLLLCLLENNIIVNSINLSSNGLGDQCRDIIISFLSKYKHIHTLNISNNSFSVQIKEKIKSYSTSTKLGGKVKIFI